MPTEMRAGLTEAEADAQIVWCEGAHPEATLVWSLVWSLAGSNGVAPAANSRHPRWLIVAFIASGGVLVVAILGLILSPLVGSASVVTVLFTCAALGSGGLFLVIQNSAGRRESGAR